MTRISDSENLATLKAVLSLDPESEYDEVKRAYKRFAQRHHPDKNGAVLAGRHSFAEIQAMFSRVQVANKRNFDYSKENKSSQKQRGKNNGTPGKVLSVTLESLMQPRKYSFGFGANKSEVVVPPGAKHGDQISLSSSVVESGHRFSSVSLSVKPHPRFSVDGYNIMSTEKFRVSSLFFGGIAWVRGLDGPKRIVLPPDLAVGDVVTVPGAGLPVAPPNMPEEVVGRSDEGLRGSWRIKVAISKPNDLGYDSQKRLLDWEKRAYAS